MKPLMEAYEWDEAKALSNLEKHGIDFDGAIRIFEGPIIESRSARRDEERWQAIGLVEGLELAVVYTWRASRRRIISARRAKRSERKAYRAAYPGGPDAG